MAMDAKVGCLSRFYIFIDRSIFQYTDQSTKVSIINERISTHVTCAFNNTCNLTLSHVVFRSVVSLLPS